VQHALRAFTPRDQKAVKSAATTMRPNPELDLEAAITELGVGEALVSLLDEKGRPGITERAFVIAPGSRLGPVTPEQRQALIRESLVYGHYEKAEDRESAYEKIKGAAAAGEARGAVPAPAGPMGAPPAAEQGGGLLGALGEMLLGKTGPRGGHHPGVLDAAVKSAARSVGSGIGREITRGVLGSILGGITKRRR
jgi:hypothetical protein